MVDVVKINALLVDTAPLEEEILGIVQRGDNFWTVEFEAVDIEVSADPQTRCLHLMSTVGLPNEDRRLEIFEILLASNFLWRDTGGVHMALDGIDGDVVQTLDVYLDGLTATDLAVILRNLAERTITWRALISADADDEGVVAEADSSGVMLRI